MRQPSRYRASVPDDPSSPPPSSPPTPRWRRALGLAVAATLLGLAVVFALRGVDAGALANRVAQGGVARPAAIGALVGLNLVAISWLIGSFTASFKPTPPVSSGRMLRLITASQLLNYLPAVRAGMVGRAAFLKRYHDLRLRDSGYILALSLILTAVTLSVASAGPLLVAVLHADPQWAWAGTGLALALATLIVATLARRLPGVGGRAWMWVPLRTLDLAAITVRTYLAFAAVGQPITVGQATLLASGATLARLTGITPNGLGLSEWVVAGMATALAPIDASLAVAATLLDRAIEVCITVVAGLWAMWKLRRETATG